MNRNLKVLGLALVAVFAMTAVLASAAQAQVKATVGASSAILTGEVIEHPTIGKSQTFTLSGGQKLSCEEVKATGTVTNGATSITASPEYSKCTAKIGSEFHLVTVTMNGCDYNFHGGVEVAGGTTFEKVEVDLVCPVGKEVEIHVYKNATSEVSEGELCTYKVAGFTNNNGNETHNVAGSPNDITITTTAKGIATTRTGSLLCGAASTTAEYTGSTTVRAFEDLTGGTEGNQVSLTLSK